MAADGHSELLRSATAGDRASLERLLLGHYDALARRIGRKLPSFLQGTVSEEDILQQTFLEVFQSIDGFEPRGRWGFYRWLVGIADHRLQDAIRGQRAAKRGGGRAAAAGGADASADDLVELLAAPRRTPSRSAARHEAAGAVHECLGRISPDYRRALELRYVQGLPVAETAEVMGRSPRAIHNLCHRGLQELRALMGDSAKFMTKK